MPYIKPKNRPKVDKIYDSMVGNNVDFEDLVDILCQFCDKCIHPSYNNYKNYFAEITEC